MKIMKLEPEKRGEVIEIEGTLEEMQEIVGGYIEIIPFDYIPGVLVVLNEEGKLLGLEPNFNLPYDVIVGTVFFARDNGEDLDSLTQQDIINLKKIF